MVRAASCAGCPPAHDRPSEWFTIMHKDKYCGEVYLELTFWLNVRVHIVWRLDVGMFRWTGLIGATSYQESDPEAHERPVRRTRHIQSY